MLGRFGCEFDDARDRLSSSQPLSPLGTDNIDQPAPSTFSDSYCANDEAAPNFLNPALARLSQRSILDQDVGQGDLRKWQLRLREPAAYRLGPASTVRGFLQHTRLPPAVRRTMTTYPGA